MAGFSDSFIEDVRDRVDLLELVGRHVQLKKSGVNWQGLCPFHTEKTPSFTVRPDRGFFKCFGCGEGGDAFQFLMKTKGLGFVEAVSELATMAGLPLPAVLSPSPHKTQERKERQQIFEQMIAARDWYCQQLAGPAGGHAREYLHKRGLLAQTIKRFSLGYAPRGWQNLLNHFGGGEAAVLALEKAGLVVKKDDPPAVYDRFRERIIFPINDLQGRCVGLGGRLLGPGKPKYINSPETRLYRKGEILYGLDHAQEAIQREGQVVVVEGYMDLIALANKGIKAVVATLGTALTESHLKQLWRRTQRILFCFDGDQAGRKAAWRALERVMDGLEADRHAGFLFLGQGEDPDDIVNREGAEGFRKRMARAQPLIEFLIHHLGEGLSLKIPEGRAALIHRVRPYLATIADSLLRELYAETLSQRLDVPLSQVMGNGTRRLPGHGRPGQGVRPGPSPTRHDGRDYEQALLAVLLRNPVLVSTYEEELCRLKLENPQLSQFLAELIDLSADQDDEKPFTLEQLSQGAWAGFFQKILAAEESTHDDPGTELQGCLKSFQLSRVNKELEETSWNLQSGAGDTALLFAKQRALKKERTQLLLRKSQPETA